MKKRIISFLLAVCMMISLLPATALAAEVDKGTAAESASPTADVKTKVFTDVKEGAWYYDAVQYVQVNGIFDGTGPTTFDPDGTMTRSMFVTVLGRMAGVDKEAYQGESAFTDVAAGQYYAPYVAWAAKYGITSGTGDGKFSPDALINRAQMAAFFVRYFETFGVDYETDANITTTPADIDSVPSWAKDAVLKLWKQGLLNGDGTNFNPNSSASRAETATLCMRTDKAVDTWYKEPGVPSERVSVDPTAPQEPEETKKPGNSGGSSGGSNTTYYNVTFQMGAGQESIENVKLPESKLYASGTKIDMLPTPYKKDYVFLGWYYDQAMVEAVGSSDTVSRNMTLYAKMGELTPLSATETPNYITVIVPAEDVDSYTFGISGYAEGCVEYFTHVSDLNSDMAFTVNGITVSADYEQGQTYSVKLKDDSSAVFVVNDVPQSTTIRVLNIITEKGEVQNLTLDGDVKYLPANSVSNMTGTALDGLFTVSTSTQTMTANKNEGTFTYNGSGIALGDTVAIYEGTQPNLRKAVGTDVTNNDGAVAYLKITNIVGNIYYYQTADTEEVLFTPDVLPVTSALASTALMTLDGETPTYNLTVYQEDMQFTDDKYAEMGLDSQTTVDVGDFIAIYSGTLTEENANTSEDVALNGYGRIIDITEGVSAGKETYQLTYVSASEEEVLAAMDLYDTRNQDIDLTPDEIAKIEDDMVNQAIESGFVEEAAEYLTALAIETDGFRELSDDLDMDLSSYSITFADGTPVDPETMDLMAVSAEITKKDISANVTAGDLKHFKEDDKALRGVRAELVMTFTVEIGSGDNKVEINLEAIFEQEVLLNINVSGGAIWKWKWIFPYIYDYKMNANIDVGTYTGIGLTATAKTAGKDDEGFDWDMSTGNSAGDKIISIGKQIKDLMDEKEKFMGEFTVGINDKDDDDDDDDETTLTNGGLAEKYADMMENAEESWIDIVRVEIFATEGYVDMFHILCYGISADFVVQANLYVTLGMTFEFGVAKRYNFSLLLFHKQSTSETVDLEEAHYQFDFYVMGTIGIRAGVEFEIAMGLFSLKLDSIGICAEVGAYAQMWGYFYYHLSWSESDGKDSSYSGAMFIEIGLYLEISFKAQLFSSDKLTYQPTLYENQWPLWSVGEQQNVYDFAYEDDDEMLSMEVQSARSVSLSSDLFMMNYMDMKSGEQFGSDSDDKNGDGKPDNPAGNFDDRTESHYTIELSNSKFEYNPDGNVIAVNPGTSTEETCEVTIIWKQGALAFSSRPLERTLTIHWTDPANARFISFNSMGGSAVPMIATGVGTDISTHSSTKMIPAKVGYTFEGWYESVDAEGQVQGQKFQFTTMGDYPDTGKGAGITLYANWSPNTNTKYTVEHYQQQLNGTYKLFETDTDTFGTTDELTTAVTKTYDGFTPKTFEQQTIAPDGSTVVKIYYDRKTFTVTFTYGDRESNDNQPLIYTAKYGATVYAPKLALGGYDFASFSGLTDEQMRNGVTVTGEGQYDAQWTPKTDTPFRVEHYVQRTTDDAYVLYGDNAIQSESGTTGTEINIDSYKLNETGLAYQYATVGGKTVGTGAGEVTATISADGKTVVKLYYDRNSYTLTFEENDGSAVDDITGRFGKTVTLPTPTKTGYTFTGWYKDADCTDLFAAADALTVAMPDGNKTLYAGWSARTDTAYTVKHLHQDVTGDGYTLYETDNKTGTTGGQTAAVAKDYSTDGFKAANAFEQATIAADGTTVVEIKYDRKTYTVSFDSKEGTEVAAQSGIRHGAKAVEPTDPTKTGYTFAGWYADAGYTNKWNFSTNTVTDDVTLYAKWEAKGDTTYKVEHYKQDVGGGENYTLSDTDNKTGVTGRDTAAQAKTYTGFTAPSVTQKIIAADGSTVVKLYYTRNQYTLTFDPANGTTPTASKVYFEEAISAPTSDPAKTGYTFAGWGTVADKMPAQDTTYTAQWTANTYTVVFNQNAPAGVTIGGSMDNQSFTYDQAQNLRTNGFTLPANSGYTFLGWAETPGGTVKYNNTQSVSNLTAVKDGTVTLYAVWQQGESVEYTVNHYQQNVTGDGYTLFYTQKLSGIKGTLTDARANTYEGFTAQSITQKTIAADGTTVVDIYYTRNQYGVTVKEDASAAGTTTQYYYGAKVTVPAVPTKEGYTFNGWSNGTETLAAGSTFTMGAAAVTLTAQWTINQYTITFNTDGGSTLAPITQDYGTTVQAPTNPAKTGYTFDGWDKEIPTSMPAENVTITAKWKINQYTITFANTGDSTIPAITQDYGMAITKPANPTRTGYEFKGWSEEIPATMPAENKTITASWTAHEWTVTFNANEGTCSESSRPVTYDDTYGTLPTPTRTGYTFDGWYLNNAKVTSSTMVATDKDHELIAHWTRDNYTISYNLNSGSLVTANPATYTVESDAITLNNPTKTGYTFTGWTGSNGTTPQTSVTIPAGSTGNRSYTANWELIQYIITYHLNGGTNGDKAPTTYTIEDQFPFAEPTKDGYRFEGWYTDSGFADNSKVTGITKGSTGKLDLYAKWVENSFTVNYELGDSAATNPNNSTTPPINKQITLQDPIREGWTFDGWYKESGFVNRVTEISATSTTTEITLYAKWKCVVTYDFDGVATSYTVDIAPGGKVTLPTIPTKAPTVDKTYTSDVWTIGSNKYNAGAEVTVDANVTYKATWTESPRTYTVNWIDHNSNTVLKVPGCTYNGSIDMPTINMLPTSDKVYTHTGWQVRYFSTYALQQTSGSITLNDLYRGAVPTSTEINLVPTYTVSDRYYTVKFVTHANGVEIESQRVKYGEKLTEPAIKTYTHNGITYTAKWYDSTVMSSGDAGWDFENDTIIGVKTLYGRWFVDGVTDYDGIVVGGFGVNSSNKNDIPLPSGVTGKVSFDDTTFTLTLDNVVFDDGVTASGFKDYFIYCTKDLTIQLKGKSTLNPDKFGITAKNLKICSDTAGAKLTINGKEVRTNGQSKAIVSYNGNEYTLTVENCALDLDLSKSFTQCYAISGYNNVELNDATVDMRTKRAPIHPSTWTFTIKGAATVTHYIGVEGESAFSNMTVDNSAGTTPVNISFCDTDGTELKSTSVAAGETVTPGNNFGTYVKVVLSNQ